MLAQLCLWFLFNEHGWVRSWIHLGPRLILKTKILFRTQHDLAPLWTLYFLLKQCLCIPKLIQVSSSCFDLLRIALIFVQNSVSRFKLQSCNSKSAKKLFRQFIISYRTGRSCTTASSTCRARLGSSLRRISQTKRVSLFLAILALSLFFKLTPLFKSFSFEKKLFRKTF